MYLRFVCARPHPYADAELGIFHGTLLIEREGQPAWLLAAFDDAVEAASDCLPVPSCVGRGETADGRRGLCWLRAERAAIIGVFRHLGWVMDELGLPVAEVATRAPGRIVYRDDVQVVALPRGGLPRAFPRRAGRVRG